MRKVLVLLAVATALIFVVDNARAEEGAVNVGGMIKASYTGATKVKDQLFVFDLGRVEVYGKPVEKVKYKLQLDLTAANAGAFPDTLKPREVWAMIALTDMVSLGVGQTKKPFGREWLDATATLDFWNRGAVANAFGTYDTGLWLVAMPMDTLSVTLGIYNGSGLNTVSDDQFPAIGARVVLDATEMLSVGVSGWFNRQDQLASAKNQLQFGGDVQFKKDALKAVAEVAYEKNDVPAGSVTSPAGAGEKALDADLSVSYAMGEKYLLGVRAGMDKGSNVAWEGMETYTAAAQAWYLYSKTVKAGLDIGYSMVRGAAPAGDNSFSYRAGMQVAF